MEQDLEKHIAVVTKAVEHALWRSSRTAFHSSIFTAGLPSRVEAWNGISLDKGPNKASLFDASGPSPVVKGRRFGKRGVYSQAAKTAP